MNTKYKNIARLFVIPAVSITIGFAIGNYFTVKRITGTVRMCNGVHLRGQVLGLTALREGRIADATQWFEYVATMETEMATTGFSFRTGEPKPLAWSLPITRRETEETTSSISLALAEAHTYANTYPETTLMKP
jgi:hypothetical protein